MDHSFERLIRSNRSQNPFHSELTTSYRDLHTPFRDTSSNINHDNYLSPTIPYRSKSYHADLNRITHSKISNHLDDHHTNLYRSTHLNRSTDLYRSERSLSHSTTNLNSNHRHSLSNFCPSYVNSYSRHYNHHNHHKPIALRTPVQINSRSRFRARNAYKAYRSQSANRLDERDYSIYNPIRSTSGARSFSSISRYSSQDLHSTIGFSKSMSDIRPIQSRYNNEQIRPHESTFKRNFDDNTELARHILNPDIYVRWLKNKWDYEDRFLRQRSLSVRPSTKASSLNCSRSRSALRDNIYPSHFKYTHDSGNLRIPTFSKTIRGISLKLISVLF